MKYQLKVSNKTSIILDNGNKEFGTDHLIHIPESLKNTPFGRKNAIELAKLFAAAPEMKDLLIHLNSALSRAGFGSKASELDEAAATLNIFLESIE